MNRECNSENGVDLKYRLQSLSDGYCYCRVQHLCLNKHNQDFFVFLFENLFLLQGPMWRQIRGQGLAYGYNMYPVVSKGLLYITLYRATNPVKAYTEARRIAVSLFLKRQFSKKDNFSKQTIFQNRQFSIMTIFKKTIYGK